MTVKELKVILDYVDEETEVYLFKDDTDERGTYFEPTNKFTIDKDDGNNLISIFVV